MTNRADTHIHAQPPTKVVDATQGRWVLDELTFVWRAAQGEAANAYCHWRRVGDRTAYAIYRAAQDRADAAQDALGARWCAERASTTG